MKQTLAMVLWLSAAAVTARAQDSFGYTATSQTAFSYVDIGSTGLTVLKGEDDAAVTLSLPFGFRFYGTSHTSVCVSTNGVMSFGSCLNGTLQNLDLTAQTPGPDLPVVAPFWDDLTFSAPGSGGVVYQTLGVAPARQFVVQWSRVYGLNAPTPLNFQLILHEGTDEILFQYATVDGGSSAVSFGKGATVGIRNAGGQTNGQRVQWSVDSPVLANNSAIRFLPPLAPRPTDVTSRVEVTVNNLNYNPAKKTWSAVVRVRNTSATDVARPLAVAFTQLPAGVTLSNAVATVTSIGSYLVPNGSAPLNPNASVAVTAEFEAPEGVTPTFTIKVYSGRI